jgi:hypothetical protein
MDSVLHNVKNLNQVPNIPGVQPELLGSRMEASGLFRSVNSLFGHNYTAVPTATSIYHVFSLRP